MRNVVLLKWLWTNKRLTEGLLTPLGVDTRVCMPRNGSHQGGCRMPESAQVWEVVGGRRRKVCSISTRQPSLLCSACLLSVLSLPSTCIHTQRNNAAAASAHTHTQRHNTQHHSLAKGHDVEPCLTQRGAHRWCWLCCSCVDQQAYAGNSLALGCLRHRASAAAAPSTPARGDVAAAVSLVLVAALAACSWLSAGCSCALRFVM